MPDTALASENRSSDNYTALVGICVTIVIAVMSAAFTYGGLSSRVTTLEAESTLQRQVIADIRKSLEDIRLSNKRIETILDKK